VAATYRPEVGKVWDHSSTLEMEIAGKTPYPNFVVHLTLQILQF
jgi:hypothetical protein